MPFHDNSLFKFIPLTILNIIINDKPMRHSHKKISLEDIPLLSITETQRKIQQKSFQEGMLLKVKQRK